MKPINEDEADLLIEEYLRKQGWNLTDFTMWIATAVTWVRRGDRCRISPRTGI
jgi:hypothetical protein